MNSTTGDRPTTEMTATWPNNQIHFINLHLHEAEQRAQHLLSLGVRSDGRVVIYAPQNFDKIDMITEPLSTIAKHLVPLRRIIKLDAGYDTEEEEAAMALPNAGVTRATVIAGEPLGRHRGVFTSDDERDLVAGTRLRDEVLDAILDSLAERPTQTKRFMAAETERIATQLNVKKFAVAGVRAALTKGMYDEVLGESLEAAVASRRARTAQRALAPPPEPEDTLARRIGVKP